MKKILILMGAAISLLSPNAITTPAEPSKTPPAVVPVILTVKERPNDTELFYSGTLAPLHTASVFSLVEGRVKKMLFSYGDIVWKGQPLFILDSPALAQHFQETLSDYLLKKDQYINQKTSFSGTEMLHKAGVISEDQYHNEKSQRDNSKLAFLESKLHLEEIAQKVRISNTLLESLNLDDSNKINALLTKNFSNIVVKATASGIALFRSPTAGSNDGGDASDSSDGSKLGTGSAVKEGQLLLLIGDTNSLRMDVNVDEVSINKIHTKNKVYVTGDAFPGLRLQGTVATVAAQAKPEQSQGLSQYPVSIFIPNLTALAKKTIRVGMTAKADVVIQNSTHILLPIAAIHNEEGQSVVTVVDPKTGKWMSKTVVTGETTLHEVTILEGLHVGDQVVLHAYATSPSAPHAH